MSLYHKLVKAFFFSGQYQFVRPANTKRSRVNTHVYNYLYVKELFVLKSLYCHESFDKFNNKMWPNIWITMIPVPLGYEFNDTALIIPKKLNPFMNSLIRIHQLLIHLLLATTTICNIPFQLLIPSFISLPFIKIKWDKSVPCVIKLKIISGGNFCETYNCNYSSLTVFE